MATKQLWVRIQPKQRAEKFFRCGMPFTRDWVQVEVDDATAKRLETEQMLEVSGTRPAGMEDAAAGDSAGNASTAGAGSGAPAAAPEDLAARLEAIRAAIGTLDKEDASAFTKGGVPKTEAIEAVTGWAVSAAERDTAWAEVKTGGEQ